MSDGISADEARRLREAQDAGDLLADEWPTELWMEWLDRRAFVDRLLAILESNGYAVGLAAAPVLAASVERLEADNQRLRTQLDEAVRLLDAVVDIGQRNVTIAEIDAFLLAAAFIKEGPPAVPEGSE